MASKSVTARRVFTGSTATAVDTTGAHRQRAGSSMHRNNRHPIKEEGDTTARVISTSNQSEEIKKGEHLSPWCPAGRRQHQCHQPNHCPLATHTPSTNTSPCLKAGQTHDSLLLAL